MRFIVGLVVLAVSVNAFAATMEEVEVEITRQMDGLLSDTVNEGEGSAWVAQGEDAVRCVERLSKKTPGKTHYFCSVDFDVKTWEEDEGSVRNCRLHYSLMNGDVKTLTADEDLEMSCIETLSEGD